MKLRIKYRRTLEDPLGYERLGMTSVRDREAPRSNRGPPTIFVFKIGDSGGCPESADHSFRKASRVGMAEADTAEADVNHPAQDVVGRAGAEELPPQRREQSAVITEAAA